MCLCLSIGGYFTKNCNIIFIFISAIGLFIANSLLAFLTIVGIMFLLLILYIVKKIKLKEKGNIKKFIITIFLLITSFILIKITYPEYLPSIIDDIVNNTQAMTNTSSKIVTTGTSRIYIWKKTFKIVDKYLLHGSGVDNFRQAFGRRFIEDPVSGAVVDKAHNDYLQKLVCEGIFSAILYVTLVLCIFFKYVISNIKSKNGFKDVNFPFFLAFFSYAVYMLASISTIRVSPIYYICMGLVGTNWIDFKRGKK